MLYVCNRVNRAGGKRHNVSYLYYRVAPLAKHGERLLHGGRGLEGWLTRSQAKLMVDFRAEVHCGRRGCQTLGAQTGLLSPSGGFSRHSCQHN